VRLSPDAGRLFRRLGAAGPVIDPATVTELAGVPCARASSLLSELAGGGLLTADGFQPYGLHALLRAPSNPAHTTHFAHSSTAWPPGTEPPPSGENELSGLRVVLRVEGRA